MQTAGHASHYRVEWCTSELNSLSTVCFVAFPLDEPVTGVGRPETFPPCETMRSATEQAEATIHDADSAQRQNCPAKCAGRDGSLDWVIRDVYQG